MHTQIQASSSAAWSGTHFMSSLNFRGKGAAIPSHSPFLFCHVLYSPSSSLWVSCQLLSFPALHVFPSFFSSLFRTVKLPVAENGCSQTGAHSNFSVSTEKDKLYPKIRLKTSCVNKNYFPALHNLPAWPTIFLCPLFALQSLCLITFFSPFSPHSVSLPHPTFLCPYFLSLCCI